MRFIEKLIQTVFAIIGVFGALHVIELYLTVWPHTIPNQFIIAMWIVLAADFLHISVKNN